MPPAWLFAVVLVVTLVTFAIMNCNTRKFSTMVAIFILLYFSLFSGGRRQILRTLNIFPDHKDKDNGKCQEQDVFSRFVTKQQDILLFGWSSDWTHNRKNYEKLKKLNSCFIFYSLQTSVWYFDLGPINVRYKVRPGGRE